MAVIELHPEGHELVGHVVERHGGVPRRELVAGVLGEVGRSRGGRRAVDRRHEHQVAAGVGHRAAAQGQGVEVLGEPQAVVEHEAEKGLLRTPLRAGAAHAPAVLTPRVHGERERRLVGEAPRTVEVLELQAVVGVHPRAARNAEPVVTVVVVGQHGDRPARPPQHLHSVARAFVEHAVRLPAVHEPQLDLQLVAREGLQPEPVEEPRGVGRDVRRLVRPVVEVVVAEQADVGHEDAGVQVDPVPLVPVVAAVRLRDVAVRVGEVPLAARGTGVVARRHRGVHAELRHQPATGVLGVEIATDPELLNLHLAGAPALAGPDEGVVGRAVEVADVRGVEPELAREVLRVEHRRVLPGIALKPGKIGERERRRGRRGIGRGWWLRPRGVARDGSLRERASAKKRDEGDAEQGRYREAHDGYLRKCRRLRRGTCCGPRGPRGSST